MKNYCLLIFLVALFLPACTYKHENTPHINKKDTTFIQEQSIYISHVVNLESQNLNFYWKDDNETPYSNFKNLNDKLKTEGKELVFAMNGGMYLKDQSPQGLYIENGIQKSKLDTTQISYGNFYMQPNGVFYITNKYRAFISTSKSFKKNSTIKFATQSGPMLLIEGKMHPKFIKGSSSIYIRNGVGILPNGNVLFAMSTIEVNFYDFAKFFKDNDCESALYLDGFVSRTYLPAKNWVQLDGEFGVIIGEIAK